MRAEGVRLLLAGDPDRAVEVSGLSLRTLYRARDAMADAGQLPAPTSPPAPPATPPAPAPPPPSARPLAPPQRASEAASGATLPATTLPADKLAGLCDLVARLPPAQQDAIALALPLEAARRETIARALAPHREAAAAVAHALRDVSL